LMEGSRQAPKVGLAPEVGFSRLEMSFDPRAAVRVRAADGLILTAAGGFYRQAPAPEDLSAVFGTPALSVSKATHGSLAQEVRVTETTTVEVTEFVKSLSDLPVRTLLPSPILARVLTQNGEGRSFGAQILVRQELTRGFFAWLSYTASRSERRYIGDEQWRLFDYDQPHVLAAVASYEIGRWTFGLRFRASSGYPRTPVIASTYDSKNDRYDPVFGPQNTTRLPAFYQLDAKIDRVFPLGEQKKLTLYIDVENITAHDNAEEYVYSFDYARRGIITGLPTIAVVGARVDF